MHEYLEIYTEKRRITPDLLAFLGILAVIATAIYWVAQVYAVQH
jgi:hypothetical protein